MLDALIQGQIDTAAKKVAEHFGGDAIFYVGDIHQSYFNDFRKRIETLANTPDKQRLLLFFIDTPGGTVEVAENICDVIRFHYEQIYFIVPDQSLSAGTILCMSGDKIYMDYSSSLGPIDPQVMVRRDDGLYDFVPALGYLDKVDELIEKSNSNTISPAEFALLQRQDLGMLRRYEQARDLSRELLKSWLVKYKFADWIEHRTDPTKVGKPVTEEEKVDRAHQIAEDLNDNKKWHSHGRRIGINTLVTDLRLEIEDYSENRDLRSLIRNYTDLVVDYVTREGYPFYLHSIQ